MAEFDRLMIDAPVYESKLMSDVPEQFKNQDKIRVLFQAMAQQLDDLATFYRDLLTARTIYTAVGKQLDYIGDIVCLTRAEASAISAQGGIMDDDLYRRYLLYKISLNTSTCTLQDIYDAVQSFAKDIALYSEDINHQATIILRMSEAMYKLFEHFKFAKAAGVQLMFDTYPTDNGEEYGYTSFFSYLPVEKIYIDNTQVYNEELMLSDLYYVIDDEREESPDMFPEAVAFYADDPFDLSMSNLGSEKTWDGRIEYFDPALGWTEWDGTTQRSFWRDGWNVMALRGVGNSFITGEASNGMQFRDVDNASQQIRVKIAGNIERLLDYETVNNEQRPPMGDRAFVGLFAGNQLDISRLEMPALRLSAGCYVLMFSDCQLTGSITLPALELAPGCYELMFAGAENVYAPVLPAQTLADECYAGMFNGAELKWVPALPAAIFDETNYEGMFTNSTGFRVSETSGGDYIYPFRVPDSGEASEAYADYAPFIADENGEFFKAEINKTYYSNIPVVR